MEECFPRRPSSFQAQMGRGTEAAVTSRLQNPASGGNDDIDLERDQFRHEFGEESRIVSSRSEFEPMFPPLHVASLPQALSQLCSEGLGISYPQQKCADVTNLGLLGAGGKGASHASTSWRVE